MRVASIYAPLHRSFVMYYYWLKAALKAVHKGILWGIKRHGGNGRRAGSARAPDV
jgi:hypothetical protein